MIPTLEECRGRFAADRKRPVCIDEDGPVSALEILGRAAFLKDLLGSASGPVVLSASDRLALLSGILGVIAAGRDVVLPPAEGRRPPALADATFLTDRREDLPPDGVHLGDATLPADGLFDGIDPREGRVHFWTSGSTGAERSFPRTFGKLLAEAAYFTRHFGLGEDDLLLATVPGIHIYGLIYGTLLPFWCGGTFWRGTPFLPARITTLIRRRGVTALVSVPAHYRALASSLAGGGRPTSLRMAFSSGGFLEAADSRRFNAATGCPVHEIYGSTETGAVAERSRQGSDGEDFRFFSFLEGRVDEDGFLQVLSPVVAGIHQEERDWSTCGDLVRMRSANRFTLLGRGDSIVKIGGNRLSLRQVEETLLGIPEVNDAAVKARPSRSGRGNVLVAAVAADPDALERIQTALRARLEPWQRPRKLVLVDALPRTATGKLRRTDLEALLAGGKGPPGPASTATEPR